MGQIFRKIFQKKLPKKQCKVVMLGLDGAGKTTTLYSLKLGQTIQTIPTIGFNVQQLTFKTIKFLVWDVGGQQKLRALWSHYFQKCRGLIYVIDSSDRQRIQLAAKQLNKIVKDNLMKDSVVLILANKRDIATMNIQEITEILKLREMERNWAIYPVTAIKQQDNNLDKAMEWMINNIDDTLKPKKVIKYG